MKKIIITLRAFCVFAILLGIIYPLTVTYIAQLFMPYEANGSLLYSNGTVIGSKLIAQEFSAPKYFHSRFSYVNYDASNSGGSNFGPSNAIWIKLTKERISQLRLINNLLPNASLPADMVFASGSGLDPHISVANALLQLPRVAKARSLPEETLKKLIAKHITTDFIGIWGQPCINVLILNLALDAQ
jgi:potassium-transporting ATPase KdpC subunit